MNGPKPFSIVSSGPGTTASARRLSILKKLSSCSNNFVSRGGNGRTTLIGNIGVGKGSTIIPTDSRFVPKGILKTSNNNNGHNIYPVSSKDNFLEPVCPSSTTPSLCKGTSKSLTASSRPSVDSSPLKIQHGRRSVFRASKGGSGINVNGYKVGEFSGSSNMMQLLEDLHKSRMIIEKDQRDYEKARREIEETEKTITKRRHNFNSMCEKWKELAVLVAAKKANLSYIEIKGGIVNDDLQGAETELSKVLDELHDTRMKTTLFTSKTLSSAVQFAFLFNGTNLGRRNRRTYLAHQKRKLMSELQEFLFMKKGTEECLREKEELEETHKQNVSSDKDLLEKIQLLNAKLQEMEREECQLSNSFAEECSMLEQRIKEKEDAVAILETRTREVRSTVQAQQSSSAKMSSRMNENLENRAASPLDLSGGRPRQKEGGTQRDRRGSVEDWSLPKFQVPTKPQFGNVPEKEKQGASEAMSDFGESNSNDEDLCLAAAAEVSQNMRTYEPVTPTPAYAIHSHGPTPSKVRAVERQLPITSFIKQLSTASVIAKPRRNRSQAKTNFQSEKTLTSPAGNSSSKSFQFKKKASNSNSNSVPDPVLEEKEKAGGESDFPSYPVNDDDVAFSNNAFPDEPICSFQENDNSSNTNNSNSFFDMPFETFN